MRPGTLRMLPSRRACAALLGVLVGTGLLAGTGFGATSAAPIPNATVAATLSLSEPTALGATPPTCTDAIAPLDTDDCTDVTFTPGASQVLKLGSLSGSDVQAGSLQWTVTTTNPIGYRVVMSNTGTAPLLRSTGSSIADMQTSPLVPASAVDDATHFGVAMGNAATDNESAIPVSWQTAGGQQGELFSGITPGGIVVAERGTPQSDDPFTATFAVASVVGQQPSQGAYAGTIRLVASAL